MTSSRRAAVFLDRDGVVNRAYARGGVLRPPASLTELEILPGVVDACRRIRDAGFLALVVTNQPDIARGATTTESVHELHRQLARCVPIDGISMCPHDDGEGCACRKPAAGMLLDAADALDLDLHASFMVGDRWCDVEAGRRAGCRTVLVAADSARRPSAPADSVAVDLPDAVDWITSLLVQEGG